MFWRKKDKNPSFLSMDQVIKTALRSQQEVFHIRWCVTDVCEFHCSYCPLTLHNGSGSFPRPGNFLRFLENVLKKKKNVHVELTGGEPTRWPELPPALEEINKLGVSVSLFSNGHKNLPWWDTVLGNLDFLSLTFHSEKSNFDQFIYKVESLARETPINIHIPVATDILEFALHAADEFSAINQVKTALQPLVHNGELDYPKEVLDILKNQSHHLKASIEPSIQVETQNKGKQDFLDYEILVQGLNNYTGWDCYSGMGQIYVDSRGGIWRGQCRSGRSLGNINEKHYSLPENPQKCSRLSCISDFDLSSPKERGNRVAVSGKNQIQKIDHDLESHKKSFVVNWNISSLCNYACSYCPKSLHNGLVRFPPKNQVLDFCNHLIKTQKEKRVLIEFTGGEVTLWRDLVEILSYLRDKGVYTGILSNGTKSPAWWEKNHSIFTQVVLTFHSEKADLEKFLTVVEVLRGKVKLSVNIVMNPDLFDLCLDAGVRVSKVPDVYVCLQPILIDFTEQMIDYSPDQLWIIQNQEKLLSPPNILTQFDSFRGKMTHSINEQEIETQDAYGYVSQRTNQWKGWQCYAGVEQVAINNAGDIQRGWCQVGGSLGNIHRKDYEIPNTPIRCDKELCVCNFDVMCKKIRKE